MFLSVQGHVFGSLPMHKSYTHYLREGYLVLLEILQGIIFQVFSEEVTVNKREKKRKRDEKKKIEKEEEKETERSFTAVHDSSQ